MKSSYDFRRVLTSLAEYADLDSLQHRLLLPRIHTWAALGDDTHLDVSGREYRLVYRLVQLASRTLMPHSDKSEKIQKV